uniref:Uncharacterized protein n=1 Tax=Oryza sativa subsp. japonica TaxID=39947 RepID=Q6YY73_ORYSJ|nr:hypothetical protein [Oryza sativa Japonica Group]
MGGEDQIKSRYRPQGAQAAAASRRASAARSAPRRKRPAEAAPWDVSSAYAARLPEVVVGAKPRVRPEAVAPIEPAEEEGTNTGALAGALHIQLSLLPLLMMREALRFGNFGGDGAPSPWKQQRLRQGKLPPRRRLAEHGCADAARSERR